MSVRFMSCPACGQAWTNHNGIGQTCFKKELFMRALVSIRTTANRTDLTSKQLAAEVLDVATKALEKA